MHAKIPLLQEQIKSGFYSALNYYFLCSHCKKKVSTSFLVTISFAILQCRLCTVISLLVSSMRFYGIFMTCLENSFVALYIMEEENSCQKSTCKIFC